MFCFGFCVLFCLYWKVVENLAKIRVLLWHIAGAEVCFVLFQWSIFLASLVSQMVKNLPAVQEILVRSLGQGDPLEKGITTHSSVLAWRIPWTEELGLLKCMESQRVRHNSATEQPTASAWERPLLASWLFWPNDS